MTNILFQPEQANDAFGNDFTNVDIAFRGDEWGKVLGDSYLQSMKGLPQDVPADHVSAFSETFENVKTKFSSDFCDAWRFLDRLPQLPTLENIDNPTVNDVNNLLKYNQLLADRFDDLQTLERLKGISAPAMRAACLESLGITPVDANDQTRASFASALLAAIPNGNTYHGNHHFIEAPLSNLIVMLAEAKYGDSEISLEDMITGMTAMDGHDFLHDGKDNTKDGVYIPCRLEKQSWEGMHPFMLGFNLSEHTMKTMEAGILATEASVDPGLPVQHNEEPSPPRCRLAGRTLRHHKKGGEAPLPILPGNIAYLADKKNGYKASVIAETMRISDILISILTFRSFAKRTLQLYGEMPEKYTDNPQPQTQQGFLTYVLGGWQTRDDGGDLPTPALKGLVILLGPSIACAFGRSPYPANTSNSNPIYGMD